MPPKSKRHASTATSTDAARFSVRSAFEVWRATIGCASNWGLAWFLANEFCERYYASHGIAPHTINHDGLGYYGIQLTTIPCAPNGGKMTALGRMSMSGDVENWRSGGPGDHGLGTIWLCSSGAPTDEIVAAAIRHMAIPSLPEESHARCRHKRHGASYELIFRVAATLALQPTPFSIWNDPDTALWRRVGSKVAADPGVFFFGGSQNELAVRGDGSVVGTDRNLWMDYMRGETLPGLVQSVERAIGA